MRTERTALLALSLGAVLLSVTWLMHSSENGTLEDGPDRLARLGGAIGPVSSHATRGRTTEVAGKTLDISALKQALQRKPGHSPILIRLAVLAASQGRSQEAVTYLKQAVSQEPANLDARLELGRILFDSGDVQGAIRQTRDILEKQPEHPAALYNLGAIYGNLGDLPTAEKYWRAVLAVSPESESASLARRSLAEVAQVPSGGGP